MNIHLLNRIKDLEQDVAAWRKQARDALSVIQMVRGMIGEIFGPVIESEEATLLRGPEPRHGGEAILEALSRIQDKLEIAGWIVGNGTGTQWRVWSHGSCEWTNDRNAATRYARREDAEAVHAEDEDTWIVVPYVEGRDA